MTDYVNSTEVARMLGLSRSAFYRKRRDLRRLGFPPPVAWMRGKWRRAVVASWIEATPVATPSGVVALHPEAVRAAGRRIAQRAGGAS